LTLIILGAENLLKKILKRNKTMAICPYDNQSCHRSETIREKCGCACCGRRNQDLPCR
jgi:hypothetical protein